MTPVLDESDDDNLQASYMYLHVFPIQDMRHTASIQISMPFAGVGYLKALLKLEVLGFPGPPKRWPVRYCADMLVSGHTFVVLLYLLGLADLVRQVSLLYSPASRAVADEAQEVIV